jgi:ketosteroid isomerase-like protein
MTGEGEMRTLLVFSAVALSALAACASRVPPRGGDVSALLRSENAFAELAAQKGTKTAFLAYLAEGSVVFRPGPVDARAWYAARPDSASILSWRPSFAEMARACDLGYTTGPWEFRKGGPGEEPVAFGEYVTVWKKLPDGTWKVAADTGVGHAKPPAGTPPSGTPVPSGGACEEPALRADIQAEKDALIREDAVFSEAAAAEGLEAALRKRAAAEVRLLREDRFPIVGLKAAIQELAKPKGTLTWKPAGAEVSASRDLGFTYGVAKRERGGGTPPEESAYLRIWRRDPQGRWKVVLDWAGPAPPPKAP